MLSEHKIAILEEGDIPAERIDSERLIDQHYYAIGSKAVLLNPSQLDVPADKFESIFHVAWSSVLKEKLAFNAMDACTHLGLDAEGLDKAWGAAKDAGKLVKLGGGFYCGLIDTVPGKGAVYVINGFYMAMRGKFVRPGSSIHYFNVEWRSSDLSFADFRNKLLGSTDPALSPSGSIRGRILSEWQQLGLSSAPNTGDNGVHASASPFEALAERMNWLKMPIAEDTFGRKLLGVGIMAEIISAWSCDPAVNGKSIFDTLEALDCGECIVKALVAYSLSASGAISSKQNVISAGNDGLKGEYYGTTGIAKVGDIALFDVLEDMDSRHCIVHALVLNGQHSSIRVSLCQESNDVPAEKTDYVPVYGDGNVDYAVLEDGSHVRRRMTCTESEILMRKHRSQSIIESITEH
ncbi:unnamed protein product, partial [Symbiodinium microadriaticum]